MPGWLSACFQPWNCTVWNHPSDLVRMRCDPLFSDWIKDLGTWNLLFWLIITCYYWGLNKAMHIQKFSIIWRRFPWLCVIVPAWMDVTRAPVESQTAWKPKSLLLLGFWFRLILISQWFSWTPHISTASKWRVIWFNNIWYWLPFSGRLDSVLLMCVKLCVCI